MDANPEFQAQAPTESLPTIPKTRKLRSQYRGGKIDVGRLLVLRYSKNLSYSDCAQVLGVSKAAVITRLKHLPAPDAVESYQANKSRVLNVLELTLASQLVNPAKLEKASLNNCAYAFGQVHPANRLELGLSTQNIAYADMVKQRQALMDERARLAGETTPSGSE